MAGMTSCAYAPLPCIPYPTSASGIIVRFFPVGSKTNVQNDAYSSIACWNNLYDSACFERYVMYQTRTVLCNEECKQANLKVPI